MLLSYQRSPQPLQDEVPTCSMCMEVLGTYGGPASLPCGHNGCLSCLQQVQVHSTMPLCPLCRTPFEADVNLCLNLDLRDAIERMQAAAAAAAMAPPVNYKAPEAERLALSYNPPHDSHAWDGNPQGDPPWPEATGSWIPVASAKERAHATASSTSNLEQGYCSSEYEERWADHNTAPNVNVWSVLRGALSMVAGIGGWVRGEDDNHNPDWSYERQIHSGRTIGLERSGSGNSWRNPGHVPSAPPLLHGSSGEDVRSLRALLEAEPPQWMADSASYGCMQCGANFRPVTVGRHHCRFCGGLFCRRCSSGRSLLPVKYRERDPQRTCDTCFERLEPIQRTLADRVSNAAQAATHDVTDATCMRGWLNSPVGLSMEQEIYKATNTVRAYYKIGKLKPERSIPDAVLKGARGLAILTVVKAGMMVTYKIGTGLIVARKADGSWSAPSAIASCGLGWGPQAGGELTDFIIVLRTVKDVKAFCSRVHFSMGAGVSAAAGPVGRAAEADFRAGDRGAATCYTYSCSKGAFVGISLEYNLVATRTATNANFYGDAYLSSSDILLGSVPRPRAAGPLYNALHDLFGKLEANGE